MTSLKEIKDQLKTLIDDTASPQLAEKVGKLSAQIDLLEEQEKTQEHMYEDLRKKYVESIKYNSFRPDASDTAKEEKPKSLEDCIANVQKQK